MTTRTSLVLAAILASATASASPLHVYESKQHAVSEGDITVKTDPDTAYRAATDYPRWAQIFPTVRSAIVHSRRGVEARVTFIHTDGTRDELHFKNRPETHTIWFEQLGGDADVWAEIAFSPGDTPDTTRVHSRLYADVHGLASMFVSGGKLRAMRQQQVRDDLVFLAQFFAKHG